MSDIFDDLTGSADDGPLSNVTSTAVGVSTLVVAERAPTGQALHVEEMVFLKTRHVPQVAFESADPDTGEVDFGNELEFRVAMQSLTPVSIQAAFAWCSERVGAVYEAHRAEIDAANAGEVVKAPGADAAQIIWQRPKWSTGSDRGQKR